MASEELKVRLTVDDQASKPLDKIAKQAKKLEEPIELTVDAKISKAFDSIDKVAARAKKATEAAQALGKALGPELSADADLSGMVRQFERMGLTLDDITANADKLGAKLKEVGDQHGLEQSFGRSKKGVEEIGRSADSSKSALANMVGNSVQDLGALSGLAGSAGVAIGQMGEYMADAALEGEGLTAVMANFAKVALPILAIGAAVGVFTSVLGDLKKEEKDAEQTTTDLVAAFKETHDWLLAESQVVRDNSDDWENYTNRITNFGEALHAVAGKIPVIGDKFKPPSTDVSAGLKAVGLSLDDVARTTEGNIIVNKQFEQALLDGLHAGKLTERQYKDITDAVHAYQGEVKDAKEETAKAQLSAFTLGQTVKSITNQTRPLEQYTELWGQLERALTAGQDEVAASVANALASLLGFADPAQVVALALGDIKDKAATAADAMNQFAQDTFDAATKLGDAQLAIDDLASSTSEIEARKDALKNVFDIGNVGVETLTEVRDIEQGFRDLATFITKDLKGKIPNILNPKDVHAADFLDKIASLRGPIQEQIVNAFASGGPEAAQGVADTFINNLFVALKGKVSKDKLRELIGVTDLDVKIKTSLDEKSKAETQKELEILTGLQGATPYTASIALALQAGTLSPQAAQLLIQRELGRQGVVIPTSLATPATGTAVTQAQQFYNQHAASNTVEIPSKTGEVPPTDLQKTTNAAQSWLNGHPVTLPVKVDSSRFGPNNAFGFGNFFKDAGGMVGDGGGIVAERGPEIVNSRYLVTQPTIVPPRTRVTSRRQTAVILRHRGLRGLKRYDSGGIVTYPTRPNVNINVSAAVIGNRFDVMRAVKRANLDAERILGTRA